MRGEKVGELVVAPENAAGFAEWAVNLVNDLEGIALDYSIDSLEQIDGILERFHQERVTVEQVWVTLLSFGCYVGEVIVRNNPGARWESLGEDEYESELDTGLVVRLSSDMVLNPIGKTEKRILNGDIDSLPYFYEALVKRGGASPA